MSVKFLAVILIFFYPLTKINHDQTIHALTHLHNDSIFGIYEHRTADGYAGTSIELKLNKTFSYTEWTDVQKAGSSGNWQIVNDALILKSAFNKKDIPVTINGKTVETSDSLVVRRVKNLRNDVVKDATILINDDSLVSCMPVFEECHFKKGHVRKIKLLFSENCTSKWYPINTSYSEIAPVVNIDFALDQYIFLNKRKFLIRREGLYELQEEIRNTNGKQQVLLVRKSSFYKRIK